MPSKFRQYKHTDLECGFSQSPHPKNLNQICKLCGSRWGAHYGSANQYICPPDYEKAFGCHPMAMPKKPTPKPPKDPNIPEGAHSFRRAFPQANPDGSYHDVICKLCGKVWDSHHGGTYYADCLVSYKAPEPSQCVQMFGVKYPNQHTLCLLCGEYYQKHYSLYPVIYCPGDKPRNVKYNIREQKARDEQKHDKSLARAKEKEKAKQEALCTPWGLEPELNLCQHAADFYLLTAANVDYPENIKIKLKLKQETEFLAEQFSAYLDMAIGGEIRHFPWQCEQYARHPDETRAILSPNAKVLLSYLLDDASPDRDEAWIEWRAVRKKHGIAFLRSSIELLNLDWRGKVYGGKTWAGAAKVLLSYLDGTISATTFVDTAWALQHNSDVIFDKLWNVEALKDLLDYNLNDNLKEVSKWASTQVLSLLEKLAKPVW